jgi:hypothetical protein
MQMLKSLWQVRIDWFWPIWIIITAVAAIGVARLVGQAPTRTVEKDKVAEIRSRHGYYFSGGTVAALAVVFLLLVCYAVLLKWEDFADWDDCYLTISTLKGVHLRPMIWPWNGRFWPLGDQEFNLICHFTRSAAGFHLIPIVQLLVVSCILFVLDDELSITARLVLTALVLTLPSIVTSFTGLVYQERNVVFWLALVLFFVKLFEKTQSTTWAVAAAICAQIMIYYKETAFLLLMGFAVGRLILRYRRPGTRGWDRSRLRDKQARLDLCLISLGLLFLLYYAAVMTPHVNMRFADEQKVPLVDVFLYYFRLDPLVWLFVAIVLTRVYLILRGKVVPSPFWDGVALGGVGCFSAYLYLHMCRAWYLTPVDFIAVLYVGRLTVVSLEKMQLSVKAAILVMVFFVSLYDTSLSAFRVFERENLICAKAELADAVAAQCWDSVRHVQRLFFPFSSLYLITEFASYLVYRGIPVEGYGTVSEVGAMNGFLIISKAFAGDGPCVDYRKFTCHAGSEPEQGDLVIELPDDLESQAEINLYRKGGELLYFYEPRPHIPQWIYPFFSRLRIVSYRCRFRELPDRWLQSSLTRWK